MSNYIALTKVLLKNSLTEFSSKKTGKISNRVKSIALIAVIGLSLLPLAFGIGAVVWTSYGIFAPIGQEGLIMASGLLTASMMVLFFGIFYIMNVFYFSRDVENLLPLPLKPSTIMAAKFTITIIYEYLTELLILAPILVVFGVVSKAGVVYYLYALIAFLTLPVIPLVYSGILNMLLMRVTNISRHRDQFRIIGGVIGMFVAIFGNIKMQSFANKAMDPEQLKAMLSGGNNSLMDMMAGIFPTNKFLALALVNSNELNGFINMLLYVGISVLCVVLFLTMGESLYFKGLLGISESKSKRKKLTTEQFDKSVVKSSIIKAYTIKELKLLVRTPVYFINCVMMNFLWPLFLLIPLFSNAGNGNGIGDLQAIVKNGSYEGIILAAAFAAIMFASGTNAVTATAISREGSNIFVTKYLAVSYQDQIMAKILTGVVLGLAAMASMLAAAIYLTLPSIQLILCIVVTGVLGVFFTSMAGILIDLNFPKLHWDNEQKAVKQNMNVMISILISCVIAAVVVIPAIVFKLNLWIVFAALIVIFGFINAVLYGLIKSAGVKLFDKIEA